VNGIQYKIGVVFYHKCLRQRTIYKTNELNVFLRLQYTKRRTVAALSECGAAQGEIQQNL
jgi:hypothetical protein